MLSAPSAVQKPSPFTESGVIDQMVDDEAMRGRVVLQFQRGVVFAQIDGERFDVHAVTSF